MSLYAPSNEEILWMRLFAVDEMFSCWSNQKFMPVARLLCLKGPGLRKICSCLALFILVFSLGTLFTSVRNVLLYPVWPNAWRPIGTLEIFSINVLTSSDMTISPELTRCKSRAPVSRLGPAEAPRLKSYNGIRSTRLQRPEHAWFLPALRDEEKREVVDLFVVTADAFRKAGIGFFMVEGSLLGAHRHKGMIPWDDDIDIAVNVSDWRKVIGALNCLEGYTLQVRPSMHWKFLRNRTSSATPDFPFLDIFFYTENEDTMFAVTSYLKESVIFKKADVFPLATATFEGMVVPVPARMEPILRTLFDYELCYTTNSNHRVANNGTRKSFTVPCSSLSYLYDMHHLLS
ncbi:hypothetical protein Btru_053000 [Bulinus truncatus]|nr:hypothetical protein Btru_053000 [Bulinus truncatus]